MSTFTQIFNNTTLAVKLQVGSALNASDVATVAAGGKHSIPVDFNATYREYIIGTDAPGQAKIIVSSDDLCDFKCITIKEANGKLIVEKELRQSGSGTAISSADLDAPSQSTAKKPKAWAPAWLSRSRQ